MLTWYIHVLFHQQSVHVHVIKCIHLFSANYNAIEALHRVKTLTLNRQASSRDVVTSLNQPLVLHLWHTRLGNGSTIIWKNKSLKSCCHAMAHCITCTFLKFIPINYDFSAKMWQPYRNGLHSRSLKFAALGPIWKTSSSLGASQTAQRIFKWFQCIFASKKGVACQQHKSVVPFPINKKCCLWVDICI